MCHSALSHSSGIRGLVPLFTTGVRLKLVYRGARDCEHACRTEFGDNLVAIHLGVAVNESICILIGFRVDNGQDDAPAAGAAQR